MNAAEIILQQLGGRKFITMTGAKNIFSSDSGNSLSFRLSGRMCNKGINYVKITLEASDTYFVHFGKIFKFEHKMVAEFSNIYADQLQALFTRETGLDTHL